MKYEIRFTGQFKKDLKRAKKQGKDTDKIKPALGWKYKYSLPDAGLFYPCMACSLAKVSL